MQRAIWLCALALAACSKDSDHPANTAPGSQSSTSTGGNVDRRGTYQRSDGPADAPVTTDAGVRDGGAADGGQR